MLNPLRWFKRKEKHDLFDAGEQVQFKMNRKGRQILKRIQKKGHA